MSTKQVMKMLYENLKNHMDEINLPYEHIDLYLYNSELYVAINDKGYVLKIKETK